MNEYFSKKGFRRTVKVLAVATLLGVTTYLISNYGKREHDKQVREVVEIVKHAPRATIALEPGELYSNDGYTKVIGPEIQPLVDSFPRVNEKEIADIFRNNIMYKGLQDLPSRLTGTKGEVQVYSAPDIDNNKLIGMIKPLDVRSKEYQ